MPPVIKYMPIAFFVINIFSLQGWTTLQLTRDSETSRGFLSARSVTGFLSDVYSPAADEVGKIHLIADERVCDQYANDVAICSALLMPLGRCVVLFSDPLLGVFALTRPFHVF